MKKQNTFFKIMVIVFVMMLFSCENQEELNVLDNIEKTVKTTEIPYADDSVLIEMQKNVTFVDYNLSRRVALLDMSDFSETIDSWKKADKLTLSEKPVIIYDMDRQPKFYEFIVQDEAGKNIGTVTSFARKEVADFTACVLPFVRDYSVAGALTYTSAYPNVNLEDLKPDLARRASINSALEKQMLQVDKPSKIKQFWKDVESVKDKFMQAKEADLIAEQQSRSLKARAWNEYYTIPQFDRDALKRTRFRGACGPAALAWVYRGFYDTYGGQYIPIHGESHLNNIENNLDIWSRNLSFYEDPDYVKKGQSGYSQLLKDLNQFKGMRILLFINVEDATTNLVMQQAVLAIFPKHAIVRLPGSPRKVAQEAIRYRKNPVYLMVFSRGSVVLHYLIGFGTKDRYTRMFWINFHTDSWIYVTDNGSNTSAHGYMPYYRNSNFFNFANKHFAVGEFIKIKP